MARSTPTWSWCRDAPWRVPAAFLRAWRDALAGVDVRDAAASRCRINLLPVPERRAYRDPMARWNLALLAARPGLPGLGLAVAARQP